MGARRRRNEAEKQGGKESGEFAPRPMQSRARQILRKSQEGHGSAPRYSTVTDFARFRGWSTSQPRRTAM